MPSAQATNMHQMNFWVTLIDLVIRIWYADSQMRDQSLLRGDAFDQQSRRFVAKVSLGMILLIVVLGVVCWFLVRQA